jgi:ribosomal protein L24
MLLAFTIVVLFAPENSRGLSSTPAFIVPSSTTLSGILQSSSLSRGRNKLVAASSRMRAPSLGLGLKMVEIGDQVIVAGGAHAGKQGKITFYERSWYTVQLPDGTSVKSRPGKLLPADTNPLEVAAVMADLQKPKKKEAAKPADKSAPWSGNRKTRAKVNVKSNGSKQRVVGKTTHFFPGGKKAPTGQSCYLCALQFSIGVSWIFALLDFSGY